MSGDEFRAYVCHLSLLALSLAVFAGPVASQPIASQPVGQAKSAPASGAKPASAQAAGEKPANGQHKETKPETSAKTAADDKKLAPVLDPNKYFGHAKLGYAAAQLCPEICAKLFCYCGCDETDEHDSLLDCFTTDHGVDCHICQEEALIALKMKREGKSLAEIQQAIDKAFEKQYPFDEVSKKFQNYKDSRLYKAAPDSGVKPKGAGTGLTKEDLKTGLPSAASEAKSTADKQADSKNGSATGAQPRKKAGSCCSGKSKKQ